MADIAKTAANVRLLDAVQARTFPGIANVAIAAGDFVCYHATNGKLILCDADAVATTQCVGMVTLDTAAGKGCTVLYDGTVSGFTLPQNAGTPVFVSVTPGAIADAAPVASGDTVNAVGRVVAATDPSLTKYLLVQVRPQALVAIA